MYSEGSAAGKPTSREYIVPKEVVPLPIEKLSFLKHMDVRKDMFYDLMIGCDHISYGAELKLNSVRRINGAISFDVRIPYVQGRAVSDRFEVPIYDSQTCDVCQTLD